mmetsp:Transcript_2107/g.6071  ORF Transcript_2107/g.6071 Transcript_2107/m.6071 type:complete len:251 (-) Transcript_2107:156-908(-)
MPQAFLWVLCDVCLGIPDPIELEKEKLGARVPSPSGALKEGHSFFPPYLAPSSTREEDLPKVVQGIGVRWFSVRGLVVPFDGLLYCPPCLKSPGLVRGAFAVVGLCTLEAEVPQPHHGPCVSPVSREFKEACSEGILLQKSKPCRGGRVVGDSHWSTISRSPGLFPPHGLPTLSLDLPQHFFSIGCAPGTGVLSFVSLQGPLSEHPKGKEDLRALLKVVTAAVLHSTLQMGDGFCELSLAHELQAARRRV